MTNLIFPDASGNFLFTVPQTEDEQARRLIVAHHEKQAAAKAKRGTKAKQDYADLTHERSLLVRGAKLVAGMDEVGRGALAGPVAVGVCVVDENTYEAPIGLTDSKGIPARLRTAYIPLIQSWSTAYAVGSASPAEIDQWGLTAALRLAGQRALAQVAQTVGPVDVVLLDGAHDWLTEPATDLFGSLDDNTAPPVLNYVEAKVVTRVKADLACAAVAGASVLAKVARDRLMTELDKDFPQYGWAGNKGYAAQVHLDALGQHGPSSHHRVSWKLPERLATTTSQDGS